jgi:hypothetical protein
VKPGRNVAPPPVRFVDGSGKSFNTIPPSDFGFYEMLNKRRLAATAALGGRLCEN